MSASSFFISYSRNDFFFPNVKRNLVKFAKKIGLTGKIVTKSLYINGCFIDYLSFMK